MAKRKSTNEKVEKIFGRAVHRRILSSGVLVEISAFPPGLPEKIQARALTLYPDPLPPNIEIETFGENEVVRDLSDEEYLAVVDELGIEIVEKGILRDLKMKSPENAEEVTRIGGEIERHWQKIEEIREYITQKQSQKTLRESMLGEAVLDISVGVDLSKYADVIKKLEKYVEPFSEDSDERKVQFLQTYALATTQDYKDVMFDSIEQAVVGDTEVADKVQSFRDDMAQPTNSGGQTSRTNIE